MAFRLLDEPGMDQILKDRGGPIGIEWEHAECALCGSNRSRLWIEFPQLLRDCGGRLRLVECRECGHIYQDPRPTRETIGLYYPEAYGPHAEPRPVAVGATLSSES